jgi:dTDP-4-dehydrorhamnose 3,5-epimerase
MKTEKTGIEDLLIVMPQLFKDSRGYFFESYNKQKFIENNLQFDFIQDNQSKSQFGTVRGLHYQTEPFAQAKLVRVLQGKIIDVAVDLRNKSKTFGKHFSIELSEENQKQLLIPRGFAHGFSVISKEAVVLYKIDNIYSPEHERGIAFNDPSLGIDWKLKNNEFIVSEKDKMNNVFHASEIYFV